MLVARLYFIWVVFLFSLVKIVNASKRKSEERERKDNVETLLDTPVQHLDDDAVWEVASYLLSNDAASPSDEAANLDGDYNAEMDSLQGLKGTRSSRQRGQESPGQPTEGQPNKVSTKRRKSHPGGTADSDGEANVPSSKALRSQPGSGAARTHVRRRHPAPASARDQFYFLHHLRPDLPALDQVMADDPPQPQPEPEPTSAEPPEPPEPEPGREEGGDLQRLLRGMVRYGEDSEGDEGTMPEVRRLAQTSRRPKRIKNKHLRHLVADQAVSQSRRKREAGLDMARFASFLARETYSQELINSFQPGEKHHRSIKKELREPIDVDLHSVALMATSLRKRSAPEQQAEAPDAPLSPVVEVDDLGASAASHEPPSTDRDTSATYSTLLEYSAATSDGKQNQTLARRRRSTTGTRRVLDDVHIDPELPDMMEMDPEDLLESDDAPLLPVKVSSGRGGSRLDTSERPALVFEESDRRATWSPWGRWGPCSVTCGAGQKARYRHCIHGPRCQPGERESDFKPCFRKSCNLPVPHGLVDAPY